MYGKLFKSCFSGSMYGSGPTVFAVWAYVVAETYDSLVEINPLMLSGILGTTPEDVQKAIDYLASPDPHSRFQEHEGRRLIHKGAFLYFIPSWETYKAIRNHEDRRNYMRDYMRNRKNKVKSDISDVKIKPDLTPLNTDIPQKVCEAWNALGSPFPKVERLTAKRKATLKIRLADQYFADNWQKALQKIKDSDFCRGNGSTKWIANFDWFLKPDTSVKLLEGNFDNKSGAPNKTQPGWNGELGFENQK